MVAVSLMLEPFHTFNNRHPHTFSISENITSPIQGRKGRRPSAGSTFGFVSPPEHTEPSWSGGLWPGGHLLSPTGAEHQHLCAP